LGLFGLLGVKAWRLKTEEVGHTAMCLISLCSKGKTLSDTDRRDPLGYVLLLLAPGKIK